MCLKKSGLPKPEKLVDIDFQKMVNLLRSACPNGNIYLSDSAYRTTDVDELLGFLNADDTNEYRYVSEYYDCDDFSFRLMGQIHSVDWGALPFGIIWLTRQDGVNHALNCFVDEDYVFWLIDPRQDSTFLLPNNWKPYLIVI